MSTALFTPVGGQQGTANGLGDGAIDGDSLGLLGYDHAVAAYSMKLLVEQTRAGLLIDATADATPIAAITATIPMTLDANLDGMIGIYANTNIPLIIDADGDITSTVTGVTEVILPSDAIVRGTPRSFAIASAMLSAETDVNITSRIYANTNIPVLLTGDVDGMITIRAAITAELLLAPEVAATGRVIVTGTADIFSDIDAESTGKILPSKPFTALLFVDQGTSFEARIQLFAQNKTPMDLRGSQVLAAMNRSFADCNDVQFECIVTNPLEGRCTLRLTPTQTRPLKPGRWVFDVTVITKRRTLQPLNGSVIVNAST
jgi:hypothetical protein